MYNKHTIYTPLTSPSSISSPTSNAIFPIPLPLLNFIMRPPQNPPNTQNFPFRLQIPPSSNFSATHLKNSPPDSPYHIQKAALKKNINEKLKKPFHKCFCAFLIPRRGRFVLRNFFFFDDDAGIVRLAREQGEREIRRDGCIVL